MKENSQNEMSIEFLALPENESFARTAVAAFCVDLDPTMEELEDIKIAVSEAVTNSIIHGYAAGDMAGKNGAGTDVQDSPGKIRISCLKRNKEFRIMVTDYGVGIADVTQAMCPFFTTASGKERSGMGFAFMEAFMDELYVESTVEKGTTVTMIKRIGKEYETCL